MLVQLLKLRRFEKAGSPLTGFLEGFLFNPSIETADALPSLMSYSWASLPSMRRKRCPSSAGLPPSARMVPAHRPAAAARTRLCRKSRSQEAANDPEQRGSL